MDIKENFEFQEDATLEKVIVRFFFFFKRPQLLNLMWSCLGARTGCVDQLLVVSCCLVTRDWGCLAPIHKDHTSKE